MQNLRGAASCNRHKVTSSLVHPAHLMRTRAPAQRRTQHEHHVPSCKQECIVTERRGGEERRKGEERRGGGSSKGTCCPGLLLPPCTQTCTAPQISWHTPHHGECLVKQGAARRANWELEQHAVYAVTTPQPESQAPAALRV
eukprot:1104663-Pelagomonas_calceolata.AAC.1